MIVPVPPREPVVRQVDGAREGFIPPCFQAVWPDAPWAAVGYGLTPEQAVAALERDTLFRLREQKPPQGEKKSVRLESWLWVREHFAEKA